MSLRVVFDTNVLFSAVGWGGTPGKCVELARTGQIQALTCAEILEELSEKLSAKLNFSDEQIDVVLGSLLAFFQVVTITGGMTHLQPDPKDDKILECAVAGQATHVVTGDRRHLLPLQTFRGIQIVAPAEFLLVTEQMTG